MSKSFWLISAAAAALTTPAYAQDQTQPTDQASPVQQAADVDQGNDQDIIITAQGRAQVLQDVPLAVSAVNAEAMQNSGASDLRALNQLAPSLLVSSTGSEANGSARIRGIGTVGDNPGLESSVAVFIDGVYRSRTGVGLNELGEIERVEVLRGPQGTLFGRNASAGLLNIITKKPNLNEMEGYAEATYGNYDYWRLGGGLTGPIGDSGLGYRLDAVWTQRDGFLKNFTPGGGSEERINDRDRIFVRGQLLYEPTDALEIRLIGDYTHRDESCCGAVYISTRETFDPTPGAPGTNANGDFAVAPNNRIVDILTSLGGVLPSAGDPFNRLVALTPGRTFRNTTEDYGGSLQVDYDMGFGALTSITSYREYKSGGAADIDYGNVDIAFRADDGNAFRQFKTFTQELRLQGSAFDDKLDWLFGGYYANEKLHVADNTMFGSQYGAFAACRIVATVNPAAVLRNPANAGCLSPTGRAVLTGALPGTTPAFGPFTAAIIAGIDRLSQVNNMGDIRANYRQDSENFAFFTHNIFNITDQLALTLGARYTNEVKKFEGDFNNNNTICPEQQQNLSPFLVNPAVPANLRTLIGGIVTLTCQGNSSVALNGLDLSDKRKEDEWTGTAILSYKPNDDLLLYGSFSKGYKAGGFNLDRSALGTRPIQARTAALFPITPADVADLQFDAEKVDAYEVGLKYSGRGFTFNVAAFHQLFSDFQLNTFNGSVFIVQNINSCRSDLGGADTDASTSTGACAADDLRAGVRSQGIELESSFSPHPDIAVTAGYTFAKTKYRRNLVGIDGEPLDPALFLLAGDNMSNAPEHVVTTSFAYTPDLGVSGLSGLFYVDGRLTSDYNTGSDLAPEKEQDSYFIVNARAGIRGPDNRWSLEVWAQNLFDVKYQQVGFNSPFQGAGSVANVVRFGGTSNQLYSSYLAEPRTYGLTVRTRF
ncbi:TonB-dependent receptor [Sphingomonas sp. LY54]|uniref:TonB-dependent receptor n=1 Tax=Sphingomonas sp. LY54 TaxID=3095343 RepID=UPI002D7A3596|nr:TonB-dependent receptor [Sphingomonas sp. LY54]WRP27421.1 TonB-dependent receptor [Sphingomonas sp. LY54]